MPTTTVNPTGGELDLAAEAPTVQSIIFPTGGELTLEADGPALFTGLVASPDSGVLLLPGAEGTYVGGPVADSYLVRPNRLRALMEG